jgi:hypothetical protein
MKVHHVIALITCLGAHSAAGVTVSIQSLPIPIEPSAVATESSSVPTESLPIPDPSVVTGEHLDSAIGDLVTGLTQSADRLERIGDDLARCGAELSVDQLSEASRASVVECRATSLADAAEEHSGLAEQFSRFSGALGEVSAKLDAAATKAQELSRTYATEAHRHQITGERLEQRLAGLAKSFPKGARIDPGTAHQIRKLAYQVQTLVQHERLIAEASSRTAENAGLIEHYRTELRSWQADSDLAGYQYRLQASLDRQKLSLLGDFGEGELLLSQLGGAAMDRLSGLIYRLAASDLSFDSIAFGDLPARQAPQFARLLPPGDNPQSILDRYRQDPRP